MDILKIIYRRTEIINFPKRLHTAYQFITRNLFTTIRRRLVRPFGKNDVIYK